MEMNDSKDFESKKLKHMMVQLLEQQQEQLKLLQEELARERTRAKIFLLGGGMVVFFAFSNLCKKL